MKREIVAAGMLGLLGGLLIPGDVQAGDLVTLGGTTYRDVQPVRVEPDGITWRYEKGVVKVDFADSPENVRRTYGYDAARATAYRDARTKARQQASEQADHDAHDREVRVRARQQVLIAQSAASSGESGLIMRRALSPAASYATREVAAQMQAELDRRTAEAESTASYKLVPSLPGSFGARPITPFMDTPVGKEFQASLHRSPTDATGNFVPTSADPTRSSLNDAFFQPMSQTRSYNADVDRAEAFARGVPLPQP